LKETLGDSKEEEEQFDQGLERESEIEHSSVGNVAGGGDGEQQEEEDHAAETEKEDSSEAAAEALQQQPGEEVGVEFEEEDRVKLEKEKQQQERQQERHNLVKVTSVSYPVRMLGDGEEFFVYDRRGKMAMAEVFRSRYFARLKDNEEGGEVLSVLCAKKFLARKQQQKEKKRRKEVGRLDLDLS
jgi:hypothetical protein